MPSSYLIHYASPYYDPVKAHEYYMKNRQLKGKRSTAGLNEKGRKAASYVKAQINKKRDSSISEIKSSKDQAISEVKSQIEELKSLSKEEKEAKRTEINEHISILRDQAKSEKERIKEELASRINQRTISSKRETDSLRARLKNANPVEKAALQERINRLTNERVEDNNADRSKSAADVKGVSNELSRQSTALRDELKAYNANVTSLTNEKVSEMRSSINSIREQAKELIKQLRDDANTNYEKELAKIKSDRSMQSKKKRK